MKVFPEETIAHYRIIEPIGSGGMGAVFKAFDKKLQRVIALKLLRPEDITQEDRRRRFLQEARAVSALNHLHILTVYEVGEENGKPYIAMEYVEGETLRQKIRSREQLATVVRFYRPLLKGKYDDSQRRSRDLEHLQAIGKRYKTTAKLLDDVALDPSGATQEDTGARKSGFVTLSTVHSAKGLEWTSLFVIWMVGFHQAAFRMSLTI